MNDLCNITRISHSVAQGAEIEAGIPLHFSCQIPGINRKLKTTVFDVANVRHDGRKAC